MCEESLLGKVFCHNKDDVPYPYCGTEHYFESEFYLIVDECTSYLFGVKISARYSDVDKSWHPVVPGASLEALKAYYPQPMRLNKRKGSDRKFISDEGNVFDLYNGQHFHPLTYILVNAYG